MDVKAGDASGSHKTLEADLISGSSSLTVPSDKFQAVADASDATNGLSLSADSSRVLSHRDRVPPEVEDGSPAQIVASVPRRSTTPIPRLSDPLPGARVPSPISDTSAVVESSVDKYSGPPGSSCDSDPWLADFSALADFLTDNSASPQSDVRYAPQDRSDTNRHSDKDCAASFAQPEVHNAELDNGSSVTSSIHHDPVDSRNILTEVSLPDDGPVLLTAPSLRDAVTGGVMNHRSPRLPPDYPPAPPDHDDRPPPISSTPSRGDAPVMLSDDTMVSPPVVPASAMSPGGDAPPIDQMQQVVSPKASTSQWDRPPPATAASSTRERLKNWAKNDAFSRPSRETQRADLALDRIKERVKEAVVFVLGAAAPVLQEFLEVSVDIGGFAPIVPLKPVAEILLRIWNGVKLVKTNKRACLRLTDICATILISIRENISGAKYEVGIELQAPIARLVTAFEAIHEVIRQHSESSFLTLYMQRREIQQDIMECHEYLRDALTIFGYALQVRILNHVVQSVDGATRPESPRPRSASTASVVTVRLAGDSLSNAEKTIATLDAVTVPQIKSDLDEDTAELRQRIQDVVAKHDDTEIIKILDVRGPEMPDAIKALQRALDSRCLLDGAGIEPLPTLQRVDEADIEDVDAKTSENGHSVVRNAPSPPNGVSAATPADELDLRFMTTGVKALRRVSVPMVLPSWTITPFELDKRRPIGFGGWGTVYKGTWQGRIVAIKELGATASRELFKREVSIWKTLQHPNVLALYGASSTASEPPWYLIAKGMSFLHHKEVLHGDLKGVNVLVNDKGHCVISDFGQSEMRLEAARISGKPLPQGTLRWKAPELISGNGKLTKETDVYAFAITVVEILTKGDIPWGTLDDAVVHDRVLRE
ncbi:hypothetical protein BD414DRAFT_283223 [Trametes punicea]|nr:hypothetical protein BD414DRAFT_283223 [Trametes punicea]